MPFNYTTPAAGINSFSAEAQPKCRTGAKADHGEHEGHGEEKEAEANDVKLKRCTRSPACRAVARRRPMKTGRGDWQMIEPAEAHFADSVKKPH